MIEEQPGQSSTDRTPPPVVDNRYDVVIIFWLRHTNLDSGHEYDDASSANATLLVFFHAFAHAERNLAKHPRAATASGMLGRPRTSVSRRSLLTEKKLRVGPVLMTGRTVVL
ncbi:hypothetical protein BL254_19440 [Protofrankia sp. BMG5.30]|nr:hypothetical protein BL254_19440 [Protofrankia sp. BMG5.30]